MNVGPHQRCPGRTGRRSAASQCAAIARTSPLGLHGSPAFFHHEFGLAAADTAPWQAAAPGAVACRWRPLDATGPTSRPTPLLALPFLQPRQEPTVQQKFASFAAMLGLVSGAAGPALAADFAPPPPSGNTTTLERAAPAAQAPAFLGDAPLAAAPAVAASSSAGLPEGTQWRYSEFINAVQSGKVERVRFSKDGTQLQLTAVDGRRALVVLPNDPELVDILARNGVDISGGRGLRVAAAGAGMRCGAGAG